MKILIAPLILHPKNDAAYYVTQNLATLLHREGHVVAISADKANTFHYASFYPTATLKPKRFFANKECRSYEEWMYQRGATNQKYLTTDMTYLLDAIDHFHPDLILTYDRLAAIAAGRLKNVPVDAIVHSAIYKTASFPTSVITEYNAFLSSYQLEQVLSLKEAYKQCVHRIGFGPVEIQPFTSKAQVQRIGVASSLPMKKGLTNRVCVFLPDIHKTTLFMNKLMKDTFLGAPYDVYVWYPGCKAHKTQNIHYLAHARDDMIDGSICVIHDGNDYYMNQCMARAIPQVIIASREYARIYNALAIKRTNIGRSIYEDKLAVSNLYENFRKVLTDDSYYEANQEMKKKIYQYGDLHEFLNIEKR